VIILVTQDTYTWYRCTICSHAYDKEAQAITCEKSKPKRCNLKISPSDDTTTEWKIGDLVNYNRDWAKIQIGYISGTYISKHEIIPNITLFNGKIIENVDPYHLYLFSKIELRSLVNQLEQLSKILVSEEL
jgi:hypothetical protein